MAIPMTYSSEGSSGSLVPDSFETSVINMVVGRSEVLDAVPMANRYFLERQIDSVPVVTGGLTPAWTTTGSAKAQSQPTFTKVALTAKETSVLTSIHDQLLGDSVVAIEPLLANEAAKGFAKQLDSAILGNMAEVPAAWSACCSFHASASVSGQVYSGSSGSDIGKFFSKVLNIQETRDGFDPENARWFLRNGVKQAIRNARISGCVPLFVEPVGDSGGVGSIYGVPVTWFKDSKLGTDLTASGVDGYLCDMSLYVWGAKQGSINYDSSNEAAYTDSTTGSLISAFENNHTVYKWWGSFAANSACSNGFVEIRSASLSS